MTFDPILLSRRLGREPGPTLSSLVAAAFEQKNDDPRNAFAPLLLLPWILSSPEYSPRSILGAKKVANVLPLASLGDESGWVGVFLKTPRSPIEEAPIVIHHSKGCGCDLDLDESLKSDFGFRANEDVPFAEVLITHQVVASDLKTYLSIVASSGRSDLCRHQSLTAGTASDVRTATLLRALAQIPGVQTVDPQTELKKAPKIKLKFEESSEEIAAKNLVEIQNGAKHILDAALKRPEGPWLVRFKSQWQGSRGTVEFRVTPAGKAQGDDALIEHASAILRACNEKHPEVSYAEFSFGKGQHLVL